MGLKKYLIKGLYYWSTLPKDKLAHFVGASVLFTFCTLLFNPIISSVIVVGFAAGKELVWDLWLKKGTPDVKDFYFSCAPVLFYYIQLL